MDNTTLKLDNAPLFTDFDNHISIEQNDRILFSAPFGTGKSTYLNEYFEDRSDSYFCFNLYPVNYSVSPNEDVFELIKFDLLLQLLANYKQEIDLQNQEFSNVLSFQALFLKEFKLTPLLLSLIGESGKVGKSAKILIDEVKKQYLQFKDSFNDERNFLESYLANIESKIGNVNEMDAYSSMITTLLTRVQLKNEKKQSVLIIDDLDRLDPEHIFRLFNIFSVNFGKDDILNKFGFKKIIFVCDIENIEGIYKHKYGVNVDFTGYIDKFYSSTPFQFDNKKIIKLRIEDILSNYLINGEIYFHEKKGVRYQEFVALKSLMMYFLEYKLINLRMILENKNIDIPVKTITYNSNQTYYYKFPLLVLFALLSRIVGGYRNLQEILVKILAREYTREISTDHKDQKLYMDNKRATDNLINLCLPFLIEYDVQGKIVNKANIEGQNNDAIFVQTFECYIHYKTEYNYDRDVEIFNVLKITESPSIDSKERTINPIELFDYAYKFCDSKNFIP